MEVPLEIKQPVAPNYRDKIIADNLAFCKRLAHFLNEWETTFVKSVERQSFPLSQKQFNRLQEVAQRIASKI